ncbi:MAG TPA: site-specific DNA-methyltransferase, partial [Clostridiales bacterium]|nr:site-specific DNA-methyltransferase [Clostridiales bacterium]
MDKSKVEKWHPENFKLEETTIWSFKNRGEWATHNNKYRGNWTPYVPRNLILRYSKEGDIVLDQFLGSGTTLVETKLLKRKGIGVDINPSA